MKTTKDYNDLPTGITKNPDGSYMLKSGWCYEGQQQIPDPPSRCHYMWTEEDMDGTDKIYAKCKCGNMKVIKIANHEGEVALVEKFLPEIGHLH